MNRELPWLAAAAVAVVAVFGFAAWLTAPVAPAARPTLPTELDQLRARALANLEDVAAWKAFGAAALANEHYQEAIEAWSVVSRLRPDDRDLPAALATLRGIAERSGRHPVSGR